MDRFKETKPYLFTKLISQHSKFIIPNFQRSYTWSNKQINDLWSALIANAAPYFIGNIVCIEPSDESQNRLQIVDGQQRLTTITLILIAIRDKILSQAAKTDNERNVIETAEERINHYLRDRDLEIVDADKQKFTRLQLGKDSYQKVLDKLIDGHDFTSDEVRKFNDVQKKILRNYQTMLKLIDSHLKELDKMQTPLEALLDIETRVRSLEFVVIEVKTDNDVYSIFEGLNSTGVGLSAADLVKNALLREVSDDEDKKVAIEKAWDELEQVFNVSNKSNLMPRFLRHYWISEYGYINTSDLFAKLKERKIYNKTPDEIVSFVNELIKSAKIYITLREWTNLDRLPRLHPDIVVALERFHWLTNDQVYSVLLCLLRQYENKPGFNRSKFIKALNKLWIYVFRASFVALSPSKYEKKFADVCSKLSDSQAAQFELVLNDFFKDIASDVSAKDQFLSNFVSDVRYSQDTIPLIRYLIKSIMVSDDPHIIVNDPTIEHILPQSPAAWELTAGEIAPYVHLFGNLTLLNRGENSTNASNKDMATKVEEVYSKSHFKLNQDLAIVAGAFALNPELAIRERGSQLAERIENIFSL